MYKDAQEMGQACAHCSTHDGPCRIPTCDFLVGGASCKDMSRSNSSVDRGTLVLSQKESKGSSAQTWRGLCDHLHRHRPNVVLFENVDSMDDNASSPAGSNYDLASATFSDLGYHVVPVMCDAQMFGTPQRRPAFSD